MTQTVTRRTPDQQLHPAWIEERAAQFRDLDTQGLMVKLEEHLTMSVEHLKDVAAIVLLLEERGADLSDINSKMLHWCRRVAYGQIMPELVVQYSGSTSLLRRLSGLPLSDQAKVVPDEPIAVVVQHDEVTTHRLVRPSKMSPAEVNQVFAADHIRDDSEQVSYLASKTQASPRACVRPQVVLDARRGGIIVTGDAVFIAVDDLSHYVSRLIEAKKK